MFASETTPALPGCVLKHTLVPLGEVQNIDLLCEKEKLVCNCFIKRLNLANISIFRLVGFFGYLFVCLFWLGIA